MPKDKRLHVNDALDIAAAWESGKPLAALCGFVRVMDPKKHDKRITADVIETCPDCIRIAAAMASTGQTSPLGVTKTAADIRALAKPRPTIYTYTVKTTGNDAWGNRFIVE